MTEHRGATESLVLSTEDLTAEQVAEVVRFVRALRAQNLSGPDPLDESWRDAPSTGWTREHVNGLRAALFVRGKAVQLAAFDSAVEQGGFVSRDEVFRLGNYRSDRKLNNWTAPFKSIVTELVAGHALPGTARLPIAPEYGTGNGYRQAIGFTVAPEIVRLVRR